MQNPMDYPISAILDTKKTKSLVTISPTATAMEAVNVMNEEKIGSVIVVNDGAPVGIFTERDVLVRIVAAGRDASTTLVEEIMTTELVAVRPSTTVEEAMRIVTTKRCRHLPVMEEGRLVGLVSIGDLTRWTVRDHENRIEGLIDYINGRYPV
jgi:CBS domain-containing protein